MEEQSGYENPLQLMTSLNFGGNSNDVSYGPVDDLNQHFVMGAERIGKQPNDLHLPQWIHYQKPAHNYVEFLAENPTFLEKASPADMLECIAWPVDGISEFQRELLYNDPVRACGSKPADFSLDMNASYMLNNDNHEASVRYLNPHNEGEPVNKFTSSEYQTYAQNHTLWTQEPSEDNCNVSQLQPRVSAGVPGFLSKPASRQRSALSSDRVSGTHFPTTGHENDVGLNLNIPKSMCRRLRIAERLKALQDLLPNSVEGNQASALDDVIDHVKYLQLQIKELSRSRLGGEQTSSPFIFLEGYGHYVLHDQMMNEPLEEMMGKLLEMNPSAATKLLESRGLYVMPMALAEVLRR